MYKYLGYFFTSDEHLLYRVRIYTVLIALVMKKKRTNADLDDVAVRTPRGRAVTQAVTQHKKPKTLTLRIK